MNSDLNATQCISCETKREGFEEPEAAACAPASSSGAPMNAFAAAAKANGVMNTVQSQPPSSHAHEPGHDLEAENSSLHFLPILQGWECKACEVMNSDPNASQCISCETKREGFAPISTTSFGSQPAATFGSQPVATFGSQPAATFGSQPAATFGSQPAGNAFAAAVEAFGASSSSKGEDKQEKEEVELEEVPYDSDADV